MTLSAEDVVARARNRATVHRFAGLDAAVRRAASEVIDTGSAATRLGLTASRRVEGYLAIEDLEGLVRRYRLHDDLDGTLTLHATSFDLDTVRILAEQGVVLTALDLAESLDPRERDAGLDALTSYLDRLRRG